MDRNFIDEVYVLMGPSSLSTSLPGTHAMRQNILDTIDRAEEKLLLVGYMLNSVEMLERIVHKCQTAKVEIHLDRRQMSTDREALEYIETLRGEGAIVKLHQNSFEGSLHAKVIIADEKEAIIGSANFTHSGSHRNLEAGLRLRGPSVKTLYNALIVMFNQMEGA